jgi:peptidoglycan-associated lipoprotein
VEEEKAMGKKRFVWLVMLAACYLGIVGAQQCGKKADTAIKSAQQAVEEARAVNAEKYAPKDFKSAEEGLDTAQKEFKKWDFKKAEEDAVKAEEDAKKARQLALDQKARDEAADLARLRELQKSSFDELQPRTEGLDNQPMKDINFDYNSAGLSPTAKSIVTANAAYLQQHPNVKVKIEGHCDERGSEEYNLALGAKRAKAVAEFIIKQGISRDRVDTISFGESMPLDNGHDESAWAVNRRAHFAISE